MRRRKLMLCLGKEKVPKACGLWNFKRLYYNSLSQKINFIITQKGILDASLLGAAFFIPWSRIDKIDKIKSSTDYLEYVDIIFHLKDKATLLSTAVELNKTDDRFFGKKYSLRKKLMSTSKKYQSKIDFKKSAYFLQNFDVKLDVFLEILRKIKPFLGIEICVETF